MADIEPLLDGTLEGATRASEIVQDLRRFSSLQAETALEDADVARVVQTAVTWVVKTVRAKPIVSIEVAESPTVRCARGPLHQILVNLIQNSLDAQEGEPEPRILIAAEDIGEWISITIRDHGPGIQAEAMTKLFEPFFTTKPIGKGLGLRQVPAYR